MNQRPLGPEGLGRSFFVDLEGFPGVSAQIRMVYKHFLRCYLRVLRAWIWYGMWSGDLGEGSIFDGKEEILRRCNQRKGAGEARFRKISTVFISQVACEEELVILSEVIDGVDLGSSTFDTVAYSFPLSVLT